MEIAHEELADAEARGITGYPLLWRIDREVIVDDLRTWYDREAADPQTAAFTQGAFELRFGPSYRDDGPAETLTSDDPIVLKVDDVEVPFAGRIDRLDYSADSSRFRVVDYNTGRSYTRSGSLQGGRALQLPIYLFAAARALGVDPSAGSAEYFYATRKGGFEHTVFNAEDLADRRADLERIVREVAEGIATGDFHAEPERMECEYCAFDLVCDARREAIRRKKADDPAAVAFASRKEIK
jgi:RecB family exonuclease